MKKHLALLLVLALLLPCLVLPASAADHPFTDVSPDQWFSDNVQYVYDNGLMNGMTTTTFGPDLKMDRAMLVTVLYRMDGAPSVTGSVPFRDVSTSGYYYDALRWAYAKGITTGITSTEFGPETPITREMMVTFFYRYANYLGIDTSKTNSLSGFTDTGRIGDYAKLPFQWAVQAGIINGVTTTTLEPQSNATRAQCAAILQRFCSLTPEEEELPNSRYDETLLPPEVESIYTEEYYISINCYADFESDSGYGYQLYLARDKSFTTGLVDLKEDEQWNGLGYVKFSHFYATGSYYYKLRTYKMEGETFVYGPWSDIGTVSCLNFGTKLDQQAQYSYDFYFMDNLGSNVYTDTTKAIYIKTDNPNLSSIRLMANGENLLGSIVTMGGGQYYDDVEYLGISDYDEALHKVPGGYLGMLNVEQAGTLTVEVQEANVDGYVVAKTFTLNVLDYQTERDKWIDSVIAAQTTSSMNPKEKMDAIEDYLRSNAAQFKYVTNVGGTLVTLAAEPNGPCFVSKRWDSATSPAMLTLFAERIGGFEEIHNCYSDYPRGTYEWAVYHHQIYVVYNGVKTYYTVCPDTSTGDVGTVQMIDFSNTAKLTHIG